MSTIDKLCQFLMMLHHKKFPIEQGATKKNMETKPMAEIVSQQIGKSQKKNGKRGRKKKEVRTEKCSMYILEPFLVYSFSAKSTTSSSRSWKMCAEGSGGGG